MSENEKDVKGAAYPEVGAGGYTRADGTVEFYGRVNAIAKPTMRVLDFGAGRAAWYEDDACEYRRNTRQLKGKVREVVACDVDEAVLSNRAADKAIKVDMTGPLPFADSCFDLIIADYVFEHVQHPADVAQELNRILAPGGWLCARTPNGLGYVAFASRMVRNASHVSLLRRAQPDRKAMDVFPTVYHLNSFGAVRRHFPEARFENYSYRYDPEPAYYFGSGAILNSLRFLHWVLPPQCASQLFIFLRKRGQ